jgi:hypothetical protein
MLKKEVTISIRLSNEEFELIKKKTEDLNLSQSDYIRHLIFPSDNSAISTVDRRIAYLLLNLFLAQKNDLEKKGQEELVKQYSNEAKEILKKWGYSDGA